MKTFFSLLIFLCWFRPLTAQAPMDSSVRFIGLPVVFYSPDTRWGFGGGGVFTFYTSEAPQRSSVTVSLAFTQRRQVLIWLPYQEYLGQGRFIFYGEAGWYDYLYQFFGIGNGYDDHFLEKYTARFPLIKAHFLRTFHQHQAAGIRLTYNDYNITQYDSTGILLDKNITGWDGGRCAGMGVVWWIDSRDDRFYPAEGCFVEAFIHHESKVTFSDFAFWRAQVEASVYKSWGAKTVIAFQGSAVGTAGDAPFFNLAQLGGTRRLRGYFDGKFRDRHLVLFQSEWRYKFIPRLGAVVFTGLGSVFGTPGENWVWRPHAGLGLRFQLSKKQKLNVRLDYGFGIRSQGFYLTFGEAF